jgi:hypothetical protein
MTEKPLEVTKVWTKHVGLNNEDYEVIFNLLYM